MAPSGCRQHHAKELVIATRLHGHADALVKVYQHAHQGMVQR